MPSDDKALGHRVRKELVKRQALDCSRVEVYALKGRVSVVGTFRVLRAQNMDPQKEIEILNRAILSIPEVREVEFNVRFVGALNAQFQGQVSGDMEE